MSIQFRVPKMANNTHSPMSGEAVDGALGDTAVICVREIATLHIESWLAEVEPEHTLESIRQDRLLALMQRDADLLNSLLSRAISAAYPGHTIVLQLGGTVIFETEELDVDSDMPDDSELSPRAQGLIKANKDRSNVQDLIRLLGKSS